LCLLQTIAIGKVGSSCQYDIGRVGRSWGRANLLRYLLRYLSSAGKTRDSRWCPHRGACWQSLSIEWLDRRDAPGDVWRLHRKVCAHDLFVPNADSMYQDWSASAIELHRCDRQWCRVPRRIDLSAASLLLSTAAENW